jgi:hypothetical protein
MNEWRVYVSGFALWNLTLVVSTKQIFRAFSLLRAVSSREAGLGACAEASNSDFLKFMSDSLLTFHFGAALVNSGFSITGPLVQRRD